MLSPGSVHQAMQFMDDPESLARQLTWWSNGDRGHWHATAACERSIPDRAVRRRGSVLEAQSRVCGACFPRALAALGVSRQWSSSLHAARVSLVLDDAARSLAARPTSGEALCWSRQVQSAETECARFLASTSGLRAWCDLEARCSDLLDAAALISTASAVEASRWAALLGVRSRHDWDTDRAVAVLGADPRDESPSMLASIFDAFAREMTLTGRSAAALDAARSLSRDARLTSLDQLLDVPPVPGREDLRQLVESSWRRHADELVEARIAAWLNAYRGTARRRDMRALGIPAVPSPGRVPDMVMAAVEGFSVPSRSMHVVLWCPGHVADAVLSASGPRASAAHGWDWNLPWLVAPAVDAGRCDLREHAEAFAVLWEPGMGTDMADAAYAFRSATLL